MLPLIKTSSTGLISPVLRAPARLDGTTRNAVFIVQRKSDERAELKNPFSGTVRRTMKSAGTHPVGLEIFAGPAATLSAWQDQQTECCAYLWGHAGHPAHRDDLLPWCAQIIAQGDASKLSELVGHFLIIVDDRARQRIHFVTDVLGMRPWFLSTRSGRLVGGSDVWELHRAGLIGSEIDHDVVGAWIYYVQEFHGKSLFKDCRRLAHSSLSTWQAGRLASTSYLDFEIGDRIVSREEMAAIVHEQVMRDFDALTDGLTETSLGLSGGFDSRYLAALAVRKPGLKLSAHVVANDETELTIAQRVADALELKLDVIATDGTEWNMYDQPYAFRGDGLPMTRQVCQLIAQRRPGVPMINGFMGDAVLRGARDQWFEKTDRETTGDLADVLFRAYDSQVNRLDLLSEKTLARVKAQAIAPLRDWVDRGRPLGKPFIYLGLFNRHGLYVSNNFLQHLDWCEAILPLCTPGLIGLRFSHDYSCFGWDFYEYLIASRFPELQRIPHNSKLPRPDKAPAQVSRASRAWAAELLAVLARPGTLTLVNRRKAIPRLLGVLAGRRDVEPVARFLQRLWLLEKRCRQNNIPFDWSAI